MPIYWNNSVPETLSVGSREVADIYVGPTHVWGWHTLTLKCVGCEDTVISFRYGEGVDSIPAPELSEEILAAIKESMKNSYGYPAIDSLNISFKGWLTYPDTSNELDEDFVENIPKSTDQDITLYAKLEATTTVYKTYYMYYTYAQNKQWYDDTVSDDSSGTVFSGGKVGPASLGDTPDQYDPAYYCNSSSYAGECTWYANGRSNYLTGSGAPYGSYGHWPNAGQNWLDLCSGGWVATKDYTRVSVGSVIVFSGHVGVVESRNGTSITFSQFNSPSTGYYHKGLKQATITAGSSYNGQACLGYLVRS